MKKHDLDQMTCSLANALVEVGEPWVVLIIKELMLGNRRFDGIQKQTGMSTNSLSSRLKKLEEREIVKKSAYQTRPVRHEYGLTRKGVDLWPVIVALTRWGDSWCREGEPPLVYRHKGCHHDAAPHPVCSHCGEKMTAFDSEPVLSTEMLAEREQKAGPG